MTTYRQFQNISNIINQLKTLNIIVSLNSFDDIQISQQNDCYAYKAMYEDITNQCPFKLLKPSIKDICILGLAITQEEQNNYITEYQIEIVNEFFQFEKPITYEDVQKYNSTYI